MAKTTGQPGLNSNIPRFDIPAAEDMEALGASLARNSPSHCCILLQGPLGAGKTTLVRGFLHALGHAGTVKSPTYTLVEPYHLDQRTVYHFDFYRITSAEDLESIGLRDYFDRSAICLVEWPEHAGALPVLADLHIGISMHEPGRQVEIRPLTSAGKSLIAHLCSVLS